ncbi:MAG: diaminopropionate ammonia-lyase [Desulfovibrionaceae bacterium]|nr:diaminopropionate ammonia-lyase [Desulfovibrionaceae bacterium]
MPQLHCHLHTPASAPSALSSDLLAALDFASAAAPAAFHRTLPEYAPTPLRSLTALAASLGLAGLHVKDESFRFGLNAFKALGGSFAAARVLAGRLGLAGQAFTFADVAGPAARARLGQLTFVTATDGNHGRGVAWAARVLGHRAVVYLPEGSAASRVENVRREGAEAAVTDLNYDATVALAERRAAENGWILVQDTSWPGYEAVPLDIMRGYTTIAAEIVPELAATPPTHVFLQAGVGSFAAAMAACLKSVWPDLSVIVVEPDRADCLFRTAKAGDGSLHVVEGRMDSMMAGLCCGVPSMQAWAVLERTAGAFISCSDDYSAQGMRALAAPPAGDAAIVSGESGAVTCGVVRALMTDPGLSGIRDELGLDASARVLLVSTEGDTDPENYARVLAGADGRG